MNAASIYLYLNALLYAVFAVWCTLRWPSTSHALGYAGLNDSGRSEYLVIYGGLQWGLAVLFLLLGNRSEFHALGLWVSLGIYVPIVAYRWITIAVWPRVSGMTLAVAGLETALLVGASVILWMRR
jgi:hypothetical protein